MSAVCGAPSTPPRRRGLVACGAPTAYSLPACLGIWNTARTGVYSRLNRLVYMKPPPPPPQSPQFSSYLYLHPLL